MFDRDVLDFNFLADDLAETLKRRLVNEMQEAFEFRLTQSDLQKLVDPNKPHVFVRALALALVDQAVQDEVASESAKELAVKLRRVLLNRS